MKSKLNIVLIVAAVFMLSACDSCKELVGLKNPLVGTWKFDDTFRKESDTIIFTANTWEQAITHTDTGDVTRFKGTYTYNDASITFVYLPNNEMNIIKWSIDNDGKLQLCWNYDGMLYTKMK